MFNPKPKRIKNRKLMNSYHEMRCLVCGRPGCDPSHAKTRGARGDDVPENIFPVCNDHHREHGRIGIVTFAEKYPAVMKWYVKNGWEIIEQGGRKRMIRPKT